MEKFGASPEQIAELRAYLAQRAEQAVCGVWPENWYAVRVFLRMSTQWRVAAGGMRFLWLGLEYQALDAVQQRTPPPPDVPHPGPSDLFDQIRCLERAALELLNQSS